MRHYTMLAALFLALGLLGAACGGSSNSVVVIDGNGTPSRTTSNEKFIPRPGNTELVVGPNRIAIGVVNEQNEPLLGDPGNSVQLQFGDDPPENATFVEAIPDASGFWVLRHTFEKAGEEPAVVTIAKGDNKQELEVRFNVLASGTTPMVGANAPPTNNPTLTSQPNKKEITTDSKPNDAFYQMTVTQALAAQKPFVIVFATPAFCQTALCGPVLENVKAVQPEFAGTVNFIHIEPYVLDANGGLANGQLAATQSTTDWNLQTEPWIFVVGSDGKITDRFEGSASPDELRQSIQAALG